MKCLYWVFSFVLFSTSFCFSRTWTNQSGKTIEADFVKLDGEQVVVRMKGKEYKLPLATLSEGDQTFAKAESERLIKEQAATARLFMGQELVPGQLHEFEFALSDENRKIAGNVPKGWKNSFSARYSGAWIKEIGATHDLQKIRVLLGVPENFDPAKGCPVFVQWASGDGKSHIGAGKEYWNTCREKGWMLVSIDGAPDSAAAWTNTAFLAGIKEFFEQLHAKYPASPQWKVATGGFSGGAKLAQWMGALMDDLEGVEVTGYWLGGCNEALFVYAMEDLNVKKSAYRKAKAYISTGDKDELVNADYREKVEKGCKDAGFDVVRPESYDGVHAISHPQLAEALDWFLE